MDPFYKWLTENTIALPCKTLFKFNGIIYNRAWLYCYWTENVDE